MPEIPGAEGNEEREPSYKREQSVGGMSSSQGRKTLGSELQASNKLIDSR